MFSKRLLIYLFACFTIASCKEGDKKEYPVEPVISFISISPATVNEGSEKIIISFEYADGDGDLGENTDGAANLFVTDQRVNVTYSYRIRQLAPQGAAIPIKGKLNVEVSGVFITNSSSQQTVSYSLYLVDRAGHQSNVISTSAVTIVK